MTNKSPGNRGRIGSSASEQYHASVISLLFGDKETKDFFTCWRIHTIKINKALWGLRNNRTIFLAQLEEQKEKLDTYQIHKDAATHLNNNAFEEFKKELDQSFKYEVIDIKTDDGHHHFGVQSIDNDSPPSESAFKKHRDVTVNTGLCI